MGNKLFNKKLRKACKYCLYSHPFGSTEELLCSKRGAVNLEDYCRKYKYDATKRTPVRPDFSTQYSAEDFLL